jgi:uncharacterized protein (TIGR00369 family)
MEVTRFVHVNLREMDDGNIEAFATDLDHLRGPDGAVRMGALLTMLDYAGGLRSGLAALPDGWVVSTNLSARSIAPAVDGPLRAEARVLRVGRNNVVTSVQIADRSGVVVDGVLTSAILVPENGPPQWTRPLVIEQEPLPDTHTPVEEWLRIRLVDGGIE